MNLAKKKTLLIQFILIISIITSTTKINTSANHCIYDKYRKVVNVAVLVAKLDTPFVKEVLDDLKNIEHVNNVKFTFYDIKDNISTQYAVIDSIIKSDFDLIVALLIDTSENTLTDLILKAKYKNIPLVLMNIEPKIAYNVSKYYNKVAFILMDSEKTGTVQGKMIVNQWNSNMNIMDKNGDGILQYVLLKATNIRILADGRSKFTVSTIKNSKIQIDEIKVINSDWSRELAKIEIENTILRYDGKIEAIISINDDMAIGAIKGLQKYGYNTSNNSKYIPVFGIGGITEARELIDKGLMAGTVIQDSREIATAIYSVGINLINNVNLLDGTNYKSVDNEIIILENPKEYTK